MGAAGCSGPSAGVTPDLRLPDARAREATAADAPPPAPASAPSIDGEFDDWQEVPVLASDSTGDGTAGFDLRTLKATSRGSTLYLFFEIGQTLNAHAGPAAEGTLLIEISGSGGSLTVDLRGRTAYADGDPQKPLGWSEIGYLLAPTVASQAFELRLELGRIGAKVGDAVQIDFGGSDRLAQPASLTLRQELSLPIPRSPARQAGTTVRVASLNTWFDGLTDPPREAAMGRLIKTAAAEVYCFQEIFQSSGPVVADRLKAIDPHGDGASWTVQRHRDLAIAFRGALEPLPLQSADQPFTGAALQVAGKRLVLFTLRPTCCGNIGSAEDASRILALSQLATLIGKLRSGALGATLQPWQAAPVVVVGDWNLVGSRQPLDLMLDSAGPALSHWLLRHLLVDDVFTWRNAADSSGFPPGRLDVLVHSPELLRRNGYVLDTRDLQPAVATELGVQIDDSSASDHLMLVADFEIK